MVEISSHYPYYPVKLTMEAEEKAAGEQPVRSGAEGAVSSEVDLKDRLELVRAQNLASPPPEPVDLARAAELLRQVQEEMQLLGKQEAGELHQVDRLRDLLYRLSQPEKG